MLVICDAKAKCNILVHVLCGTDANIEIQWGKLPIPLKGGKENEHREIVSTS